MMVFSCSCTRRTKVLLVGASDMIVGGLGVIGFGLAIIIRDIAFVGGDPRFWRVNWDSASWKFLGIFLSALVMGVCTISAVTYKNNCCSIIATILRSLWCIFWVWMTALMLLGVLWYGGLKKAFWSASLCVLIPGFHAIAQMYFIHVVLNYRKKELVNLTEGERKEGEKSSTPTAETTAPEFEPLTPPQLGGQEKV